MIKFRRLFNKRNAGGYTLVEVIIATALLGILIVGIMGFVTPVFSILQSSDEVKKAERSVTTIEHYLAKDLRKSIFIKVFTNASADDVKDDPVKTNADFKEMLTFLGTPEMRKNYTLRCISIKLETDNNIRNKTPDGKPAQKYILNNETYNWTTGTLDPTKTSRIFEDCFYEDIYPKYEFEHKTLQINSDTKQVVDPASPPDPSKIIEYTPAVVLNIKLYNNPDITNDMNLLFTGKSVIEVNNIKNTDINGKGKYKIFEPTDLSLDATYDGTDIYIFYITRNIGTATKS